MKVLMSPGHSPGPAGNQYIKMLVESLGALGESVQHWTPFVPFQTGDVFHIHWPEIIPALQMQGKKRFVYPFVLKNFKSTIETIHRKKGKIIWTVHNLRPHSKSIEGLPMWQAYINWFSSAVDGYVLLTPAGRDEVLETYPNLKDKPWCVAHHPHYRGILPSASPFHGRSQYNIPEDAFVFGLLGALNAAKGACQIIEAFAKARVPNAILFLAGACDAETLNMIEAARAKGSDIRGVFRHLSEQEVADFHAIIDMTVFPSTQHLNSGTIYHSLSCDVPVRTRRSPTNEYIADQIGREWFSFIEKDLFDRELVDNLMSFRVCRRSQCDLSAFVPEQGAKELQKFYKKLRGS